MSLQQRLSVARPLYGAVHLYQIEPPPGLPAWFGSPSSFVASVLSAPSHPVRSVRASALAKRSFAGGVARADAGTSPTTSATTVATRTENRLRPFKRLTMVISGSSPWLGGP